MRLGLAIPLERVLLSGYGAWHYILNHWYLPADEGEAGDAENVAWEAELVSRGIDPYRQQPLPEPWEQRLWATWERIFEVERLRETNTIQACFERLELEHVWEVTEFEAASRKREQR